MNLKFVFRVRKPDQMALKETIFLNADDTEKQIELLFRQYYSPLCRTVNRLVSDKDAAKDIVQDVFVKIWSNSKIVLQPETAKSYLYRASINAAYSHLEKYKRFSNVERDVLVQLSPVANTTLENMALEELTTRINAALDCLPPKCRAVFVLSRYEDLSYREIAEALEISPKTVENQMSKALEIMRIELKDYLPVLVLGVLLK